MKKIVYIIMLSMLFGCSDFLKESSQDLVIAKTPTDLDEVMLGSGYLQSNESPRLSMGQCGAFLNTMDDDINTVINHNASTVWDDMRSSLYGYTTWQYEVGRTWSKTSEVADDGSWNSAYTSINAANMILVELDRVGYHNEADRIISTRVRGEAHFLRAQLYLVLANLYGDAYVPSKASTTLGVPLKLTGYVEYDKNTDGKFRRNNLQEIYQSIVIDLKYAIQYLTESPQLKPLHRASAEAATLLLSRVYLYMQDWENAKTYALQFHAYNKPLVNLISYEGTFMSKSNIEILFSQGNMNFQGLMSGNGGDFCVSTDLSTIFDQENDTRYLKFFIKSNSTDSIGVGGKYPLHPLKHHISDVYTLRTAEGYLNIAEAYAMLGDNSANKYLNELRARRIKNYVPTNYSGDELIEQVRQERRKELCFEGHRWFDLRRYAVCDKLPYSREITRIFSVFDEDHKNSFRFAEVYKLAPRSSAYTLSIPKSVMESDAPYMIDNIREKNEYIEIISVDFSEKEEEEKK